MIRSHGVDYQQALEYMQGGGRTSKTAVGDPQLAVVPPL
jgi:hypothetical protein